MLAINAQVAYAVIALMVAGVCDLFDGVLARGCKRSRLQQDFGSRLDSLVDACSFGLAPLVLVYAAGLRQGWAMPILVFFALCVVWRLAFFDVVGLQGEGKQQYFVGLPVTYVAMFLPLAFLSGFFSPSAFQICVALTMLGLAFAMISTRRIRKPRGLFYVLFPLAGLILAAIYLIYADNMVCNPLVTVQALLSPRTHGIL